MFASEEEIQKMLSKKRASKIDDLLADMSSEQIGLTLLACILHVNNIKTDSPIFSEPLTGEEKRWLQIEQDATARELTEKNNLENWRAYAEFLGDAAFSPDTRDDYRKANNGKNLNPRFDPCGMGETALQAIDAYEARTNRKVFQLGDSMPETANTNNW